MACRAALTSGSCGLGEERGDAYHHVFVVIGRCAHINRKP